MTWYGVSTTWGKKSVLSAKFNPRTVKKSEVKPQTQYSINDGILYCVDWFSSKEAADEYWNYCLREAAC